MRLKFSILNRYHFSCRLVITFFWIIGFIAGLLIFRFTCNFSNVVDLKKPSIFGLFFSSVLPVIFATVFAHLRYYIFLILTIILKAAGHGAALMAVGMISRCNSDTSLALLLFSQCCCSMLMLISCFYLHSVPKAYQNLFICSVILSSVILLVIDYYWIIT